MQRKEFKKNNSDELQGITFVIGMLLEIPFFFLRDISVILKMSAMIYVSF